MTTDTLAAHVRLLRQATMNDLDELLTDLLVRAWPTKHVQDN